MRSKLLTLFTVLFIIFLTAEAQVIKLNNNGNIHSGVALDNIGILNAAVYNNDSVWRTDGTMLGTYKFSKFMSYGPFSIDGASKMVKFKNKVFFPGTEPGGDAIFYTDGTPGGTSYIRGGGMFWDPFDLFVYKDLILCYGRYGGSADYELFKTDGTQEGTSLLKEINPIGFYSSSSVSDKKYFYNPHTEILFFRAYNPETGIETYRTNGTTGGTYLLKDLSPLGSANGGHIEIEALGNLVIYSSLTANGIELYKSDGTTAGTELLKDIAPGVSSSNPNGFLVFNNKMYFTANEGVNGNELWVTDGTTAGTVMVKDINPGSLNSTPDLSKAIIINNRFIFSATTSTDGTELWSSDGTEGGTQLFKDINPGTASSNPFILLDSSSAKHDDIHNVLFNGKVFLFADNGTVGNELWVTDGTVAGTQLVKDINAGTASSRVDSFYRYSRSGMYFSANNTTNGNEVWKTDGTEAGTSLVADINPGAGSSAPRFLMVMNSELYFTANDGDNTLGNRDLYKVNAQFLALPVTLLDFSATPNGQSVRLIWKTAAEINTDYFAVERSINGRDFTEAGKVAASNDGDNFYSFNDDRALSITSAKIYYRLKMVDKDGSFIYSNIEVVNVSIANSVVVYPNPVQDHATIIFTTPRAQTVSIKLTDASGKQVYNQSHQATNGSNQYNIAASGLSPGIYYIQVMTLEGLKTTKFVKN